jgi:hypothetical protein
MAERERLMRLPDDQWLVALGATGGTLLAVSAGSEGWTTQAYSAIGACAVIVAGGILLLGRIDKAWMERRKLWDDYNKDSLTQQLRETNESLARMRASLCEANTISQASLNENTGLRDDMGILRSQFLDIAKNLHNVQKRLLECEDDRIILHAKLVESMADRGDLHALVQELQNRSQSNERRIDAIEGSGEQRAVIP